MPGLEAAIPRFCVRRLSTRPHRLSHYVFNYNYVLQIKRRGYSESDSLVACL